LQAKLNFPPRAVCTVASRYYTKRKDDLYRKCLRIAKRVAFDVMSKGYKSTEICQGFLLLCNWNQPAERFEEERTCEFGTHTFRWPFGSLRNDVESRSGRLTRPSRFADQFSGLAIRMATDLNLHRKTIAQLPPDVGEETKVLYERELLNRERAWIYSFIIDRSCVSPSSCCPPTGLADDRPLRVSQRRDPDGQAVNDQQGGLHRSQRLCVAPSARHDGIRLRLERDGRAPSHCREYQLSQQLFLG
jgi:hypothetical protein